MNRRAFLTGLAATTSALAIARAVPATGPATFYKPGSVKLFIPSDVDGGFELPSEFLADLRAAALRRGWMTANEVRISMGMDEAFLMSKPEDS